MIEKGRQRRPFRGIITTVKCASFLAALLLLSGAAWAQTPLQGFALHPPCDGPPHPGYAPVGSAPVIATWDSAAPNAAAWQQSSCLHWTDGKTRLAAALAAQVHASSLDELLTRYGALSQYKSIQFWSTMHQAWEGFVVEAGFTDGPNAAYTYPDLKPADFVTGKEFYYYETDSRTGRTVNKLTVHLRTADRVELTTENLTAVKYSMFTIFEPHALKTATFIERRGSNEWGYYTTIGVGEGSDFIATHSASPYINRLTALYRYMAGLPTDGAPAAAPN